MCLTLHSTHRLNQKRTMTLTIVVTMNASHCMVHAQIIWTVAVAVVVGVHAVYLDQQMAADKAWGLVYTAVRPVLSAITMVAKGRKSNKV